MNSIEIVINNLYSYKKINIDIQNSTITTNNGTNKITKSNIDKLLRIIRNWNNNYPSSNQIDSEKFIIKINDSNQISTITGNGSYPENYHLFKELIGELYE